MSELKAMVLVGVGILVVFVALSVGLVLLGAGGDLVFFAMVSCAALNSAAMTKVIKHYVARDERQEREARLLR